jgi:hypothetical protein
MANATAKPCRRCFALVPLALTAAHEHWHRELEPAGTPEGERAEVGREDAGNR